MNDETIISGVSVCTIGEAKGHDCYIDAKTLETALSAWDKQNIMVKLNHGTNAVDTVIGYMTTPRIDGDKLRADFHIFKHHERHNLLVQTLTALSDSIGFSMHFSNAEPEILDGKIFTRIEKIHSVDLVDRPATNEGLFSEKQTTTKEIQTMTDEQIKAAIDEAVKLASEGMMSKFAELESKLVPATQPTEDVKPELEVEMGCKPIDEVKMGELLEKHKEQMLSELAKIGLGVKPVSAQVEQQPVKEKTFSELVKDGKDQGFSSGDAIKAAIKKDPKGYEQFLKEGKTL